VLFIGVNLMNKYFIPFWTQFSGISFLSIDSLISLLYNNLLGKGFHFHDFYDCVYVFTQLCLEIVYLFANHCVYLQILQLIAINYCLLFRVCF
jgi:hypothetical protein